MRLSYNGYYTRLPSQGRGFDSHQPLNIKVLRQTEEANLVVASSYNAVVKWISMNSLYLIDTKVSIYAGVAQRLVHQFAILGMWFRLPSSAQYRAVV